MSSTSKPGSDAGPPYEFTTELTGQFGTIPLKDQVMLTKTQHGYRFWSGQQDSHLVVTQVGGRLKFVDTGTKRWKKLSPACQKQKVEGGGRRGMPSTRKHQRASAAARGGMAEARQRLHRHL